jgi:hypothetical protein
MIPRLEQLEDRLTPVGLLPFQVSSFYNFNQSLLDGTGQTIVIVDAFGSPNIQSDVATFDNALGLPPCRLLQIGFPKADTQWNLEASLDVEWAHAMAPGANIVLIAAFDPGPQFMFGAVRFAAAIPTACVVSMSWGLLDTSAVHQQFDPALRAPGIVYIASAGDSGPDFPFFPATNSNTTSIAGVITGTPIVWPDSGKGEVAFGATNFAVILDGQLWHVSGTSAGSPQWAAIVARADEARFLEGMPSLSSLDVLLSHPEDFQNNAGLVLGLGTPNVPKVLDTLALTTTPRTADLARLAGEALSGNILAFVTDPLLALLVFQGNL